MNRPDFSTLFAISMVSPGCIRAEYRSSYNPPKTSAPQGWMRTIRLSTPGRNNRSDFRTQLRLSMGAGGLGCGPSPASSSSPPESAELRAPPAAITLTHGDKT